MANQHGSCRRLQEQSVFARELVGAQDKNRTVVGMFMVG